MIMTTRAAVASFRSGLPLNILPPTIRDAVTIARCLGLQYIWIDCLCIIQDDPIDWEIEAAKMGSYYQSAYYDCGASRTEPRLGNLLHAQKRLRASDN